MRKGRIKYYFKNKNAVINDVGKLCDMNEQLEQELEKYKNIVDELETYLQRKYDEYIDMESDDAFTISLVLDTLRELKGE